MDPLPPVKRLQAFLRVGRAVAWLLVGNWAGASLQAEILLDPQVLDLGRQPRGATLERTVEVRNTGTQSVVLQGWETDCNCTRVEDGVGVLGAGETRQVRVQFQTREANGPLERHLVLRTDRGEHRVRLHTVVSPYVAWMVSPSPLVLAASPRQEEQTVPFQLTPLREGARVLQVESGLQWLDCQWEERNGVTEVRVTRRAGAPVGRLQLSLRVTTDQADEPHLDLPVYLSVTSGVSFHPAPVVLTATVGAVAEATLVLRGWGDSAPPVLQLDEGEVVRGEKTDAGWPVTIRWTAAGEKARSQRLICTDQTGAVMAEVAVILRPKK